MRTWHKIWCCFTEPDGSSHVMPFMGKSPESANANAQVYASTYLPQNTTYKIVKQQLLYTGAKHERK